MSNILLRLTIAMVVLFSIIAVGARTARSTPDDQAVKAAPVENAAPVEKPSDPAAIAAGEKITTDLLGDVIVPMTCTITPGPNNCANICTFQHKCDGYCSPHGGCVCFGSPPCL